MTHNEQQIPWYRQFWPWFLILLPATAVVASLSTLYIASTGADDLVVDDYYKDGLAINRQLEKQQEARARGISAQLALRGDNLTVTVSGPVTGRSLSLTLSHPMEADRDFSVNLVRSSAEQFRARLPALPASGWHWILRPGAEDDWRLDGELTAANFIDANAG